MMHKGNETWLEAYPDTRDGFRDFCNYVDTKNVLKEEQYPVNSTVGNVFLKYGSTIPCYSDFIRYMLWHNNAMRTIQNLQLQYMVLHYESYAISHNKTANRLLHFLGLNLTHKLEEFRSGDGYRYYFQSKEVEAVKHLVEEISDDATWEVLERYFS
eukprot:CAMPEP_0183737126 /NCGR_PEP_ID=MMETSP0737-20130205/51088_1 /TAXON_ID=385413 /ORGANISM="Thalassiosira miniscula, Strain CCMP1093" /LENGTH=155 /DNA_ID=CAMNT_0025971331 /DNA_START=59 /DNA_END=526 /DNA_ORIENTATION=-